MPTPDYYIQKWIDDTFNPNYDPFKEIERIASKCGMKADNKKQPATSKNPTSPFEIQSVLSNRKKNAFTVVWADGTSTMVHCQPGDKWDDEKALAMCFTKKALGNKGNFNDKFNDALDNKMKVIHTPESAKEVILAGPCHYTNAPEKECKCDGKRDHGIHPCVECKMKVASVGENRNGSCLTEEFAKKSLETLETPNAFGINKQTVEDLQKSALKASHSFTEMVEALANESKKPVHTYKVYIRIGGVSHHDTDYTSILALRRRIHEIAEELYGKKPYYYRTWMEGDRMQIDFGHYTQFIEVEGITPDEFAKN